MGSQNASVNKEITSPPPPTWVHKFLNGKIGKFWHHIYKIQHNTCRLRGKANIFCLTETIRKGWHLQISLRSWRDFTRECFCFGGKAVNVSGDAVRGLVKSRVEFPACPNSWGFLNYAFTSAREFRIGWEYQNVKSNVNLHLSSFPGETVCFHTQICKVENAKKCIEEALDSLNIRLESRKIYKRKNKKEPLKSWFRGMMCLAYTSSKFYGSWHMYICRSLLGQSTYLSLHSCLWRAPHVVF